jgi:hypothetical protein
MLHRYAMSNIINTHKGHWFSKDTMHFFKSRLSDSAWTNEGDPYKGEAKTLYFVSTEKGPNGPRRATIRAYNVERDSIETLGEFQEYATPGKAFAQILKMLKGA